MAISNFIFQPQIVSKNAIINYLILSIYFLLPHESSGMDETPAKRSRLEETDFRTDLKNERDIIEENAVDYMKENSNLPEDDVRTELRKYIFTDVAEMQMKFVKDWVVLLNEEKSELPDWSQEYKISNPELYSRLRYAKTLDKENYSMEEAKEIFANIFPNREISAGNLECLLNKLLGIYHTNKVFKSASIGDFFALHFFTNNGYREIGGTSSDAKIMREAFYRLALRQSDDPLEQTEDLILYRGGTRHPEIAEELFGPEKEDFEIVRFTPTTEDKRVSEIYQYLDFYSEDIAMSYEMKFSSPFVRASLHSIFQNREKEIILLPGSKFDIVSVRKSQDGRDHLMEVELSFKHDYMSKEQWHKKIMDELEDLEKNGPAPYLHDQPSDS